MSERNSTVSFVAPAGQSLGAGAQSRRASPGRGRRGGPPPRWVRWLRVVARDTLMVVGTLGATLISIRYTKPIFANQPTVIEALKSTAPFAPIAAAVLGAPPDTSLARLVATPEFARDRQAFAADLVATGRMSQARADSIAYYAVREAYVRKIPPAVIFGVMLTENAKFISRALSDVGAVGLMQVYPKVWLKALSARFGSDLAADSTNLKYGVYILSTYIKSQGGKVDPAAVNKGLLAYNGCVHGSHTPNCRSYPGKVQSYVDKLGGSICGDKSFYACIAAPFVDGLFGKESPGAQ